MRILPSCIACLIFSASAFDSFGAELPQDAADLFQIDKIWTVHLSFAPDQWEAMEPKQAGGFGGFFGGPPRGGGPPPDRPPGDNSPADRGGRRGPGGPGQGRFGAAMFLAPSMMADGDKDRDGKLTESEFDSLAESWFTAWDKEKTGTLNADHLAAGLGTVVGPRQGGPPPGPGRGGGFNLQGPPGKRNGLASMMGIEFPYVHADLEFEGQEFKNVAVRYKGNGTFLESRGSNKRSLKIDLNEFVDGHTLAGQAQLNLHNNVTDPSWMNEVLAHRLFRDAGVPAPRTAYARVYVTVPGKYEREYFGLYSLVEDVGKPFAEDNFKTKQGALFKPVSPSPFADLGDDWSAYTQTYDPKTKVTEAQQQRLIDFCKLVSYADDATFADELGDYIDLDNFARYLAVVVWLSDIDGLLGPGQNFYVYLHPETNKLLFIAWDQDHSFGHFPMRGSNAEREQLNIHQPWQGDNYFLARVFHVDEFKRAYLARIEEFSRSLFLPERFHEQVDELAAAIRPAVEEEAGGKLARFDRVVAGESARAPSSFGPPFGGFFQQPPKPIKPFVTARAQSVLDQMAGKSAGKTMPSFGFGGGGRGPGRDGGRGPGTFLAGPVMSALDTNEDKTLTHDEFKQGFVRWFDAWDSEKTGTLTDEALRAGIDREIPLGPPTPRGRP
jgi:hypothetical protein